MVRILLWFWDNNYNIYRSNDHCNNVINDTFEPYYNRAWLVHEGPARQWWRNEEVRWSFPGTPQISTLLKLDQPAREEAIVQALMLRAFLPHRRYIIVSGSGYITLSSYITLFVPFCLDVKHLDYFPGIEMQKILREYYADLSRDTTAPSSHATKLQQQNAKCLWLYLHESPR